MHSTTKVSLCVIRVALLLSTVAVSGCGNSNGTGTGGGGSSPGGGGAPAVPSVATLAMDLTVSPGGLDLDAAGSSTGTAAGTAPTPGAQIRPDAPDANHLQASDLIMVINSNIAEPLALPVLLLQDAAAAAAARSAAGDWVRSFDQQSGGRAWTANLEEDTGDAGAASGQVAWALKVTSALDPAGCCSAFELMTGTGSDTAGHWVLHDLTQPSQPANLFAVDYILAKDGSRTLTFTMDASRPPAERLGGGSVVTYAVAGDAVTVTCMDSSETGQWTLTWSQATKAGSETDPTGKKSCWDTAANLFANVPCS
jgi:hypothetical protein